MATAPSRPQVRAQITGAGREPALDSSAAGGHGVAAPAPLPLANLTGGAAFVVDPSLRCLIAEGDALDVAGLDPGALAGRPLVDVLGPVLAAALEPQFRLAFGGHPFACAHEAHGRSYLSRGVPLHGGSGAIDGALVLIYDITGRLQADALRAPGEEAFADPTPARDAGHMPAQAAARDAIPIAFAGGARAVDARAVTAAAAARLGQVLGASQVAYAHVDAEGLHATIDDEWHDGSMPSSVGRHRLDAFAPGLTDELGAGRTAVVDDVSTDPRIAHPDARAALARIRVRACVAVPLVKAGRLVAVLAVVQDEPRRWLPTDVALAIEVAERTRTTLEQSRAEARLRAREEALIEADRRKDEFLAVLAHELRNPLAPIRTGLELIRLSGEASEAIDRTREIMERQVGHMVRLIDDLLDVSRINSGKIELQRRPTPLDLLVRTALDANRAAIAAAQLRLDLALPDAPVWLDADPTRLVQVISNVLYNAVKFTDAGGRIGIAAAIEDGGPGAGPVLALAIADSGIGISPEMQPRIFDLFIQDRALSSRSHGGLGIGLALARRLVEMHGGSIEAHSDGPGCGSVFTIRLPVLSAGDAAVPAGPPPRADAPRTRHRVVVIDDNLDAANALAMLVVALGGEARAAADGAAGLTHVVEWLPTLVLLDIDMPRMDGYETCRRIRAAMGARVAIVALTGWGQEQHKRDAERAGFDAYLTKPADPAALERLLADSPRTDPIS